MDGWIDWWQWACMHGAQVDADTRELPRDVYMHVAYMQVLQLAVHQWLQAAIAAAALAYYYSCYT
uniref:Uncharacterized protein n=1 Tax=Oryza sativa subsp. japonica TaxID=39947 RepID=Q5Z5Y1_ORYSJ|nr:hypothetical protein [Oryza sativa Japonica Group]BAD54564.1 hypothetical protein [Oryza sativa Japonica Group]